MNTAQKKHNIKNLSYHLIMHKRIETSVSRAKEVKRKVERLISRAAKDTVNRRRYVAKHLPKKAVKVLFEEIGPANANRPGGYTRLLRTGKRKGDGRQQCILEIIDV